MKKVTGIGGVFFKCKDPKKITEWYQKHLGLNTNPYGATFEWYEAADSTKKAQTQWTPFSETTKYFEPSTKDFMINYRVTPWFVSHEPVFFPVRETRTGAA